MLGTEYEWHIECVAKIQHMRITDLENVRLEKLKKEEAAQFAHPVP